MLEMRIEMDLKITMVTPIKRGNKDELQAEMDANRQQFSDDLLKGMLEYAGPNGDVQMKSFNATIVEV